MLRLIDQYDRNRQYLFDTAERRLATNSPVMLAKFPACATGINFVIGDTDGNDCYEVWCIQHSGLHSNTPASPAQNTTSHGSVFPTCLTMVCSHNAVEPFTLEQLKLGATSEFTLYQIIRAAQSQEDAGWLVSRMFKWKDVFVNMVDPFSHPDLFAYSITALNLQGTFNQYSQKSPNQKLGSQSVTACFEGGAWKNSI
jgi:hypothetical protein